MRHTGERRSSWRAAAGLLAATVALACASAPPENAPRFPVAPKVFLDRFGAAEGLTFNGSGELFIGADRGIWRVSPDGSAERIADVHTHLGQAGIGERDILAADFGPTSVFRHGPNDDGIVWRVTRDGTKTVAATGIADPNFVLVREDGSFLVSDDGTDKIYLVSADGAVRVWSQAVPYPNGLALSLDGTTLYVAQIFARLNPVVLDGKLWAIPLDAAGDPGGPPELVVEVGQGLDGLAVDRLGRVYLADNGGGKIWRVDPETRETMLVAEGMPHVASLVFGEGDFDRRALYATSTQRGGGTIWKVPVGVEGARLHR